MKVVIKLKSGVLDANGKEMICVYNVKEDGSIFNRMYFRHIKYAYAVARLKADLYHCLIVGYVR